MGLLVLLLLGFKANSLESSGRVSESAGESVVYTFMVNSSSRFNNVYTFFGTRIWYPLPNFLIFALKFIILFVWLRVCVCENQVFQLLFMGF